MEQDDSGGPLVDQSEYPGNTYVVTVLIAWLIPRVYMDWNRFLLLVRKNTKVDSSNSSSSSSSNNHNGTENHENNHEHHHPHHHQVLPLLLEQRLGRVQTHVGLSIVTWSTILITSSGLVAYATQGIDPRMVLILAGISRICTAAVSLIVSLELPQWLGVYDYLKVIVEQQEEQEEEGAQEVQPERSHHRPRHRHRHPQHQSTLSSHKKNQDDDDDHDDEEEEEEVLHNHHHYGAEEEEEEEEEHDNEEKNDEGTTPTTTTNNTTPAVFSMRATLFDLHWDIMGQFARLYWIILLFSCSNSTPWGLPVAYVVGIFLGMLMTYGVYFGRTHFMRRPQRKRHYTFVIMAVLSIMACILSAFGARYIQDVWNPDTSVTRESLVFAFTFLGMALLAALLHKFAYQFAKRKKLAKQARALAGEDVSESHFQLELFSPDTAGLAARGMAHAAHKTAAKAKHGGVRVLTHLGSTLSRASDIIRTPNSSIHHHKNHPGAVEVVMLENGGAEDVEATSAANTPNIIHHDIIMDQTSATSNPNNNHSNSKKSCDDVDGDGKSERSPTPCSLTEEDDDEGNGDHGDDQEQEGKQAARNIEAHPSCSSTSTSTSSYQEQEPSWCSLFLSRIRCCKCCCTPCGWTERGSFSRLNTIGKIAISLKWFFRFVGHGLCVYATIVNIGATQQGNYAKELFPTVDTILYDGQAFGPVCAYLEPFSDNLTQSFENAQAAADANYTIAHCGACAQCSTWQNLRLQWTTRFNLAILSQRCAMKLIFGGYDASLQCHLDTIGFDVPCSECWVAVEDCAIQHCAFIQMQSWIINNLGNFEVGPDVVTAAMCEEAICEVDFVPCSGANRRRMNIVSDISRPGSQQCSLVPDGNEKWEGLFGPPDPPIEN